MRLPLTPWVWRPVYWIGAALPGVLLLTGFYWRWPSLFSPPMFVGPLLSALAAAAGGGSKQWRVLRLVMLPVAILAFFLVGVAVLASGGQDLVAVYD